MPSPLLPEHRNNPAVNAYRRLTGAQPHHRSANILERIMEKEALQPTDAEFRILIMILAATDGARLDLEAAAQRMHNVNMKQQDILDQNRREYLTREIEIARDVKAHTARNEAILIEIEKMLNSHTTRVARLAQSVEHRLPASIERLLQAAYIFMIAQVAVVFAITLLFYAQSRGLISGFGP